MSRASTAADCDYDPHEVALASTANGWKMGPIVVELKVDGVSRRASVNSPLFGAMSRRNTGEHLPLRTDTNGDIDFGSYSELRNAWTILLDREICQGETCTYRDSPNGVDVVYGIEDSTSR